jgi:hypothetical protein
VIANGITGAPPGVIGCLLHHWKPAPAATATTTPVTMSFRMNAMLVIWFCALVGAFSEAIL